MPPYNYYVNENELDRSLENMVREVIDTPNHPTPPIPNGQWVGRAWKSANRHLGPAGGSGASGAVGYGGIDPHYRISPGDMVFSYEYDPMSGDVSRKLQKEIVEQLVDCEVGTDWKAKAPKN